MANSLSEVWLYDVNGADVCDQLLAGGTFAFRLALGNGSAFDLYLGLHPSDEEPRTLVISPDGFPSAVLALDQGPVCLPKRFAGMPDSDAVGMAYFATMLRYALSSAVLDWRSDTWSEFVESDEFQDALHAMGRPAWTEYERRPAGVPEWTQDRRPQTEAD